MEAFFISSTSSPLTNPLEILLKLFYEFQVLTLALTIGSIVVMLILRDKLNKVPFIAILVILGIALNWKKFFLSAEDLCNYRDPEHPDEPYVDCAFYILKLENLKILSIGEIITLIPAALVLSAVLLFEQFLYL